MSGACYNKKRDRERDWGMEKTVEVREWGGQAIAVHRIGPSCILFTKLNFCVITFFRR